MESHHSSAHFKTRVTAAGLGSLWGTLEEAGLDTEASFTSVFFTDSPTQADWKAFIELLVPSTETNLGPKLRALWVEVKAKVDAQTKLAANPGGKVLLRRTPASRLHPPRPHYRRGTWSRNRGWQESGSYLR